MNGGADNDDHNGHRPGAQPARHVAAPNDHRQNKQKCIVRNIIDRQANRYDSKNEGPKFAPYDAHNALVRSQSWFAPAARQFTLA